MAWQVLWFFQIVSIRVSVGKATPIFRSEALLLLSLTTHSRRGRNPVRPALCSFPLTKWSVEQSPWREDSSSICRERFYLLRKAKIHCHVHRGFAVHQYILQIYSAIKTAAACVKVGLPNPNLWHARQWETNLCAFQRSNLPRRPQI
jgi:hypothetical protein